MKFDVLNFAITSIVSIGVGILISRHFASRRKVAWTIIRRKILDPVGGKFPSSVKVFFDDREVTGVTEWRFGVWNSGNRGITNQEITSDGKLKITFENDKVLKTTEPAISRDGILRSVDVASENVIEVTPELLDVRDSFAFTIYTTGDYSERKPIRQSVKVNGHILHMPKGPSFVTFSSDTMLDGVLLALGVLFYAFIAFWSIRVGINGFTNPNSEDLYAYISSIFPEGASSYLIMFLGVAFVIFGFASSVLVLFALIALPATWLKQPPKFIRQSLSQSDGPRGRSYFLSILRRRARPSPGGAARETIQSE